MSNNIVVVAEVRSGKLKRPSLEAISAGRQLAAKTGGKVIAIAIGHPLDQACADLQKSGADQVVAIDAEGFADFSGDGYARALLPQIQNAGAGAVLMPHTAMGKDLLPRLAAMLATGLITDVTALQFEGGKFSATKPIYAGKANMQVTAQKAPFLATLRPNNFEVGPAAGNAPVTKITAEPGDLLSVVKQIIAATSDRVPLQEAKVVVCGGRGLREPEQFHLIEALAAAFGPGVAAVAATRAVVDAGWRPHREQVGQTGKVVSPTLYIAVGLSGAIQHIAGMRTARIIVAINKDADAPIFKIADYGIVGDVFEVLPVLTKAVQDAVAHK